MTFRKSLNLNKNYKKSHMILKNQNIIYLNYSIRLKWKNEIEQSKLLNISYDFYIFSSRQTLNLTENLAMEHQHLVQELDKLKLDQKMLRPLIYFLCYRSINKLLIDERDLQRDTSVSSN